MMDRHERDGLQYYTSELFENIAHGIFTRHGGVSDVPYGTLNTGGTVGDDVTAVRENHQRMYRVLDVNGASAVTTWQVHGADVVIANNPVKNRRWLARADGVITDRADLPLVMRYADCVPLLFHDPVKQVIGVAHAGWRGTVQGMGANMVEAMRVGYGSQAEDIRVVVGPSISPQCFQVGEEVVDAFEKRFGALDDLMERDASDGTAYINLWEANKQDLLGVGVAEEHIEVSGICTYRTKDDFFSHRAEKGKTGRFGVVMSL